MNKFILLAGLLLGFSGVVSQAKATTVCGQEDGPSWVWSKCGNHERGIVLKSAHCTRSQARDSRACWTVVGPIRFCRLDRAENINWKITGHLRGDHYARTKCF